MIITKGPDHDANRLNDNFTTCLFFISSDKSSSRGSVLKFGILHAYKNY